MAKKQLRTPNTQIRSAMGRLFLRSRERSRCLKGAVCDECGSDGKVHAHHIHGINWDRIFTVIREELLTDDLQPLCKECHDKKLEEITSNENSIRSTIIDDWDYNGNEHIDEVTGVKVQRKKNEKPDIHDIKKLMTQVVTFDEMPIKKVTWDNKSLKALMNAGVIPKDVASIQTNYNIAVTYPKPEDE